MHWVANLVPQPVTLVRVSLILLLALLPCFFLSQTLEHFEFPKVSLLASLALVLAGVGLYRLPNYSSQQIKEMVRDPLCLGVGLFLLSALVSTLTSVHPQTSWRGEHGSSLGLMTILAYGIVFFAVRQSCQNAQEAQPLLFAWMAGGAATAGYGLLQILRLDPLRWEDGSILGHYERPAATLGHANHLGALLAMLLPLTVYWTFHSWNKRRGRTSLLWGLVTMMCLVVLAATMSRAAWLAGIVAALVGAIGWWWSRPTFSWRKTLGWSGVAALILALGVWWNPGGAPAALWRRLINTESGHTRLALWDVTWQVVRAHPLVGCGPDALNLVFGEHRTIEQWRAETFTNPTRAHNEGLHVLATQGLLGLAALLVILFGLFLACRRAWNLAPPEQRGWLLALYASLAAFLVVSCLSYAVVGYGIGVVLLAGVLAGMGRKQQEKPGLLQEHQGTNAPRSGGVGKLPWSLAVCLGMSLVWTLGVAQPFRASVAAGTGNDLCSQTPRQSLAHLHRAVELDPGNDWLWLVLAGGQQNAARQSDGPTRVEHLLAARTSLQRAWTLNPRRPDAVLNLAKVLAELARYGHVDPVEVWARFEDARRSDPINLVLHMEASQAALALDDIVMARNHVTVGLRLDPEFGPLLAQQGYFALRDGQAEEAVHWLAKSLGGRWVERKDWRVAALANLAAAQQQCGRLPAAEDALTQALALAPASVPLRLFHAQLLERLGNNAASRRAYQRVLELAPDHPAARQALETNAGILRVSGVIQD